MSPNEEQLRAALREGEGDRPNADLIIASARAARRSRRRVAAAIAASVAVVIAIGGGITALSLRSGNSPSSSAAAGRSQPLPTSAAGAAPPAARPGAELPPAAPSALACPSTPPTIAMPNSAHRHGRGATRPRARGQPATDPYDRLHGRSRPDRRDPRQHREEERANGRREFGGLRRDHERAGRSTSPDGAARPSSRDPAPTRAAWTRLARTGPELKVVSESESAQPARSAVGSRHRRRYAGRGRQD
jgi:hypothetical protein